MPHVLCVALGVAAALACGGFGARAAPAGAGGNNGSAPSASPARGSSASLPLRVGVKLIPPFVRYNDSNVAADGSIADADLRGFSIELWHALAVDIPIAHYEFYTERTTSLLVNATAAGRYDVAIAGISITERREKFVDFTHTMFDAGIGVLIRTPSGGSELDALGSPVLWNAVCLVIVLVYIFAHIVWCCERNDNDAFASSYEGDKWRALRLYAEGIWESVWFSFVTITTVGYGDKAPITKLGRVGTIVWMMLGLAVFGVTVGTITSEMSLAKSRLQVTALGDLAGRPVCTVTGTTSQEELAKRDNLFVVSAHEEFNQCVDELRKGIVDAVIYDTPALQSVSQSDTSLYTTPFQLAQEPYGIALPRFTGNSDADRDSALLRKQLNVALLGLREDGTYDALVAKYFTNDDVVSITDAVNWSQPSTYVAIIIAAILVGLHGLLLCWMQYQQRGDFLDMLKDTVIDIDVAVPRDLNNAKARSGDLVSRMLGGKRAKRDGGGGGDDDEDVDDGGDDDDDIDAGLADARSSITTGTSAKPASAGVRSAVAGGKEALALAGAGAGANHNTVALAMRVQQLSERLDDIALALGVPSHPVQRRRWRHEQRSAVRSARRVARSGRRTGSAGSRAGLGGDSAPVPLSSVTISSSSMGASTTSTAQ